MYAVRDEFQHQLEPLLFYYTSFFSLSSIDNEEQFTVNLQTSRHKVMRSDSDVTPISIFENLLSRTNLPIIFQAHLSLLY